MSQAEKNKIIVLEPVTKTVEELLNVITQKDQAEIQRVSSQDEALQISRQFQPCMLILCLNQAQEIASRVNLLKSLESSIKYGLVKILFVSKLKNKQAGNLITSMGVTDYMEEPVPLRTLQFKATIQLKSVDTVRKQQDLKKASQEKIVFKKSDKQKADASVADAKTKSKPALQLDEDAFLFRNSGAKKVGKKLSLEVDGPDPSTGEWVPHEDKGNAQSSWRWLPHEEKEAVAAGKKPENKDGWVHSGDKPQFQESTGKWQLNSEKPDLSFHKNGEKVASKVTTDENGEVSVAEDSPLAEENIRKSKDRAKKEKEGPQSPRKKGGPAGEEADSGDSGSPDGENAAAPGQAAEFRNQTGGTKEGPPGEFHNGTGGKKEQGRGATNKVGPDSEEGPEGEQNPKSELEKKEKKKSKGGMSALDFLKNKKKQLESTPDTRPDTGEDAERETEAPAAAETSSAEEITAEKKEKLLPLEKREKNKKPLANAAQEALERLKKKMGASGKDDLSETTDAGEPTPDPAGNEESLPGEQEEIPSAPDQEKITAAPFPGKKKEKDPVAPRGRPDKKAEKENSKRKRKEVFRDIQGILAEPLKEKLEEEEREKIREELGIPEGEEISDRDLAKKNRMARIQKLKDGLLDLDTETREDPPPPETNVHDLKAEEPENTWSSGAGGGETEAGPKRRAIDSDLAEEEEKSGLGKQLRHDEKKTKQDAQGDEYFYLPRDEVQPIGGAWESTGEYYVYLGGEIRYRGFDKIEDILPLWFYEGPRIPELLDKTRQWRFVGGGVRQASTNSDLPREVRDFLIGLREQARKEVKFNRNDENSKKDPEAEELTQASKLKEIFAEKEKKSGTHSAQQEKIDRLKEKLGREDNTEAPEAEAGSPETPEESPAEGPEEENSPSEEAAASGEEKNPKKDKSLHDRLAALKDKLKDGEEPAPGEEAKGQQRESPAPEEKPAEIPDAPIGERLKGKSASMASFLERRKKKAEQASQAQAQAPETPKNLAPEAKAPEADQANPYLGIMVTISNSFGPSKNIDRSIGKILNSLTESFGQCVAFLVRKNAGGAPTVFLSTTGKPASGSPPPPEGEPYLAIPLSGGDSGGNLEYLYLGKQSERADFGPVERELLDKAALAVAALLARRTNETQKVAA
jgi:DNA-binding response OmpR family regulator